VLVGILVGNPAVPHPGKLKTVGGVNTVTVGCHHVGVGTQYTVLLGTDAITLFGTEVGTFSASIMTPVDDAIAMI